MSGRSCVRVPVLILCGLSFSLNVRTCTFRSGVAAAITREDTIQKEKPTPPPPRRPPRVRYEVSEPIQDTPDMSYCDDSSSQILDIRIPTKGTDTLI